jgi:cation transport protein ChaC
MPITLSETRLGILMQACLRGAPAGPLRLFAYGSLIWQRDFPHVEAVACRVPGFDRRYCLWDETNRGTPAAPSLTLGLVPGTGCGGVAFTLPDAAALWPAWKQEMQPGGYTAIWVALPGLGPALSFLADPTHRLHAGERADALQLIAEGHGANGSARDYLEKTRSALRREGVPDEGMEALSRRLPVEASQAAA